MASARWTASAVLDLEDVLFYVAVEAGRPSVADKLRLQVQELCDSLARSPLIGEARGELGRDLRMFSFKRWVIIYRPAEDGVDILGFVDGARDYGGYFRSR